jgi:hypothetical protein
MRRGGLIAILCALGSGTALAQSAAPDAPVSGPAGQPGVDIATTLYPRTPASNVTQTAPTLAARPAAPDGTQGVGFNTGNITLYPAVNAGSFYDDNVFASSNNRRGDWAHFVRPEIGWTSNNWAAGQAAANAFVEKRWYSRFNSEDQLNAGASASGSVQPDANTQIVGRFQYLHAHEDRGSSDNILTTFDRPIAYDQVEAAGALNKRFNRVWTSLGAAGAFIRFDDPTIAGFTVSQSYREGVIGRVPLRLGYVVAPLTSVFVEVAGNRRDFQVDAFDSNGYRVVGGMLFEPGPGSRIKGEAFAGYMSQIYQGGGFQNVSTWTYGASLAFLVAQDVTAVFEGRREAREASLSGGVFAGIPGDGVSIVETAAAVRADIRVRPNFVVGAGVSYLADEFLGAGRTDRSWSPLVSAKYLVNPHLTLGFDYRNLAFDSSGFGVPTYYRNVYLLSANIKL